LAPGTICRCGQEAISIVCSRGILDLLEVQAESGKRIQCRDCAHNYRLGQRMEASSDDS
jgi:methionyl-tRNA formyltransferase